MATERLVPGGAYVNETETKERLVPGGAYVNETVEEAPASNIVPVLMRQYRERWS